MTGPGRTRRGARPRPDPRAVAVDALVRIETEGAYANLVLPGILERSGLSRRDRAFATELVYGTTRMRRACDHLVDRFVMRPLDAPTRATLRLGAHQLHHLATPAHAAVSATVAVAPTRAKGLVNAVLRKVASTPVTWPDDATRLSYPDWIVERLVADLGEADAMGALEQMDAAPEVTERADSYVQDLASQWVADLVAPEPGDLVADVCAAPGGKATALAGAGVRVVAADLNATRARLVAENAGRLGATGVSVVVADARWPPWAAASFGRVLVDAPCSGLGVLRRRPDARWRVEPDAVRRLGTLQREIVSAAAESTRPGGLLVYSVCTLTSEETLGVDRWLADTHPDLVPEPEPPAPWRRHGRGALLLPQAAGTDGMFLLRLRRPGRESGA